MKPSLVVLGFVLLALFPQASAGDDHADHHPGGAAPAPETSAPSGMAGMPAPGASAPGGMAGTPAAEPGPPGGTAGMPAPGASAGGGMFAAGMASMMSKMMPPPASGGCVGGDCGSGAAKTPLYPSLMTIPALTPEKRAELTALATQQITEGMARLAKGSELLNRATQAGDNAAMQHAVGLMHEGLDELGAGIAARRVVAEGQAPRNLALGWFRREMSLASPVPREAPRTLLGVTPIHLFTMVLLIAFALAMVAMYFFKMRRAAALFGRLEAEKGASPPGGAPPLAGASSPPATGAPPAGGAPPPGKPPPSGGTPPPEKTPPSGETASPANPAPSAETTPASPAPTPASPAPPKREKSSTPGPAPAGAPPPSAPATPPAAPPGPPAASTSPAAPGGDAARIASRAGELWQARGRPIGSPDVDWLRAKEELAKPSGKPPTAEGSPPSSATPPAVSGADSAAPRTANWRGQLRVGSVVTETPSVKTLRLVPESGDGLLPFTFVPGQFLNVAFSIGGARMNRSYSISSSPTQRDHVDLTVRREPRGAVSRHIVDLLGVGDSIEVGGPVGRFTFSGTESNSIVLLAGGVGITPMVSISRYLTELSWPGDIFLVYVCRAPTDFILQHTIAALQRVNPKLHVAVTMTRAEGTGWKGARGHLTKEFLTQSVPDLPSRRIHLCGPPAMMDSAKAILFELGVRPDQVKTEAFGLTKPIASAAGTTSKPTAPATGPLVTFSKHNKSAKVRIDLRAGDSPPKQTVLELSEELAIGIEFSCRVGTCGVCKVKMTSGEVDMAVQDALDDDDKTKGIILACQAKPKGDIAVEA